VSDWSARPEVSQVSASVGAGELVIYVPADWNVVVQASVGFGAIVDEGVNRAQGEAVSARIVHSASAASGDARSMEITATVDIGQITVRPKATARPPFVAPTVPTVPTPLVTPQAIQEDPA